MSLVMKRRATLPHGALVDAERRAERRAEEEERLKRTGLLELALDRLKKEQEINLLAMRVQCLWRRRKASRSLEDQMRRLVEEEREAAARAKSSTRPASRRLAGATARLVRAEPRVAGRLEDDPRRLLRMRAASCRGREGHGSHAPPGQVRALRVSRSVRG